MKFFNLLILLSLTAFKLNAQTNNAELEKIENFILNQQKDSASIYLSKIKETTPYISVLRKITNNQSDYSNYKKFIDNVSNSGMLISKSSKYHAQIVNYIIAKNPDLLVLDEPVQGVDFKGEISLYELIKEISDKVNCGILLISHDLHVVMSSTDYVVCLNGHVCCSGTPQSVANNNKYQELFGDRASTILSVYEHKHDHTHSADGTIKRKQ